MLGEHIRSNVIGYLALFVALSGTAYAASNVDPDERKATASKKKKAKRGPPGPQGPQGPPGPATGVAGGDLIGNYPNPLVNEGQLGTSISAMTSGTQINIGQLNITPGFDDCNAGGGLIIPDFDLTSDVDNARIGVILMDQFVGFSAGDSPDYEVTEDFDDDDTLTVVTGGGTNGLRGHLNIEYTGPGSANPITAQIFFRSLNNVGTCTYPDVVGRVIG